VFRIELSVIFSGNKEYGYETRNLKFLEISSVTISETLLCRRKSRMSLDKNPG
jgi:hypothetical protein